MSPIVTWREEMQYIEQTISFHEKITIKKKKQYFPCPMGYGFWKRDS
jgi:predicted RNA-binding Zn-ribbon protein involved in translation (DUF1610 family)